MSIKHANKLLYVGAGDHIEPVKHFILTKEFIFIDTLPRNEFDSYLPNLNMECYKEKFIYNLVTYCGDCGFMLESVSTIDKNYYKKIMSCKQRIYYLFHKFPKYINPTLLVFTNQKTGQKIKYYISTNIKYNMNKSLQKDIETSDGLIVSGFQPEIELLKYFKQPKSFFGYTESCYTVSNNKLDVIRDQLNIFHLFQNDIYRISKYFNDFFIVKKYSENGNIISCIDFFDFKLTIEYQQNKNKYKNRNMFLPLFDF
jgi:hypothetical protein